MLREVLLLLYAGAIGFVAAGITTSFYKMVTSERARFGPNGSGVLPLASAFLFGAVSGPVIVVTEALRSRRSERIPMAWVWIGVGVAGLWSCCSGILLLHLILTLRRVIA